MAVFFILANALCVHRIDNFLEACDVSACNIVSFQDVYKRQQVGMFTQPWEPL